MTHFHLEAKARFGIDRIVTARVGDLFVEEVSAPFEIREMEGMERIYDVSRRRDIVLAVPEREKERGEEPGVVVGTAPPPPAAQQSRELGGSSSPQVQQSRDLSGRSLRPVQQSRDLDTRTLPQVQTPLTASRGVLAMSSGGKAGKGVIGR